MKNTISFHAVDAMNNELEKYPIVASVDNHSSNNYLFCVDIRSGEVLADCNLPGKLEYVVKHLQKIKAKKKKTVVIYEAGNAGFYPYQHFTEIGFACKIIAPSSLPKRKKKNKTDRVDAMNNLKYHCASLLRYVVVPCATEQDNRELTRYRIDISHQIIKQKQKIISLTKRFGKTFSETKSNWNKMHYAWLRRVDLPTST